jgi:hypothetical protein
LALPITVPILLARELELLLRMALLGRPPTRAYLVRAGGLGPPDETYLGSAERKGQWAGPCRPGLPSWQPECQG